MCLGRLPVDLQRLASKGLVLPILVWAFYASILFLPGACNIFGPALVFYCLATILLVRPLIFVDADRLLTVLLLAYPASMLPSALVMGAKIGYFYPTIRAFLFIPFVMGLRATGNQLLVSRGFFLGGSAGGLAAAFFSGYSLLMHPGVRVGAPISNPIPFAQIATILALMAFVSIFNSDRYWERILSVLGFLGAVFTIYASGSYGPLLGCCSGLLVIVAFLFGRRPSRFVLLGVGILLVAFVLILMSLLAGKFHQIISDISSYAAGSGMDTSQGNRLILWSISMGEIAHSPFYGIGPGHFGDVLEDFCAANQCSPDFRGFNHVHSQYFETALNSGLIGLLGLLVSLVSPAVLFFRRIGLSGAVSRDASITGLAVVVAAMTSMVSQPLYAHNISTISYFLTISVCWFLAYPSARQG